MKKTINPKLPLLVMLLFTMAIYGITLFNDYALDDLMVINSNSFTKKGISGIREIFSYDSFTGFWGKEKTLLVGGRYRPLSIATFAVEKSVTGEFNPMLSHLINILLYALTGMLIYIILVKLIKSPPGKKWYLGIPFLATMLFLAHPVHTEVVANIKGRDEILALLFPLITLWLVIRYTEKQKIWMLLVANISFFMGLLSKENAIMFVVIVPLTLYFFTRVPLKKNLAIALPLLGTAMVFIFVRFLVLGQVLSSGVPKELLNNPFLEATGSQRFGTILYTLGLYVKLLFFPHPLTHDYYPYQIPLVALSDIRSIIPAILYGGLIFYCIRTFRQKNVVVYGILFYLITLVIVSNLIFPVGTFMNERFIYMPSLGFVLAITYLIVTGIPKMITRVQLAETIMSAIIIVILLLFSVKTYTRDQVWKNDFTLFTTDVKVSENSIKCNISAGGDYIKKATGEPDSVKKADDYRNALKYLEKAIRMAPASVNALVLYGNVNALYLKDYKTAIDQYIKVLTMNPGDGPAMTNVLKVLGSVDDQKELAYKINTYLFVNKTAPGNSEVNYHLGVLYGRYAGKLDSAAICLEEAVRLSPNEVRYYKDLGIICSMRKNFTRAIDLFTKAAELDPGDQQVKKNLEITRSIMQSNRR
ncbi:MAG: tetratricopeptide repeat protein [Bacteroidota bacterium]